MEDKKNPRGAGRKPGATGKAKERIWASIDPVLMERLIKIKPNPKDHSSFVEEALKILLDIYEGRRKLPEQVPE